MFLRLFRIPLDALASTLNKEMDFDLVKHIGRIIAFCISNDKRFDIEVNYF